MSIEDLIEYHKKQCNRYTNGMCYTRRCLVRGGWSAYHTEYYDLKTVPTCEEHETIQALERLLTLGEKS